MTTNPRGARTHRSRQVAGAAERRQDQHPAARHGRAQPGGGVQAVAAGHLDVEQRDVRGDPQRGRDDLAAGADLGDHLDVGLQPEHRGQRPADHRLVVGEQHRIIGGRVGAGSATRSGAAAQSIRRR